MSADLSGSDNSGLIEAIRDAERHLRNIAVSLEELRDKQRPFNANNEPLPDSVIPSAAIFAKAIRMTQRDLAAALDRYVDTPA